VISPASFWTFWLGAAAIVAASVAWVWLLDRREEREAEARRQRWANQRTTVHVVRAHVPDHIPADWLEQ
jgi:hypothetical protein